MQRILHNKISALTTTKLQSKENVTPKILSFPKKNCKSSKKGIIILWKSETYERKNLK